MTQAPKKTKAEDIADQISQKIDQFDGLADYSTRELVEDANKLGEKLVRTQLKTTQIRKFLDAVNQLKAKIKAAKTPNDIEIVKAELPLLRAKLAYATARQQKKDIESSPVEPLKKVLDIAIKRVRQDDCFPQDFTRLVQLIESIIAYHRYAGGKDQ
ncbi:MAG: type III-A CRISPR-associated protein Csm2 [Leptolyngbya sp. UWPOB_LEPTO1]|uniref:type III-A CRISPR-associated protein Csm2 n=1 Tax=Leptolyngbya sp. UWPOB_LEPTO1 TaxID=2815653 RepID=UPI001AC08B6A|nr:type III-A CRISPR-associated protein Csm2 [Leptolyngbya sp. UWPOB_LEPTO1]MBN8563485.1 type III-A CRISPR-associated protein Csm2 [Leptolyngbya sp. UWPOB_LEPTO1]